MIHGVVRYAKVVSADSLIIVVLTSCKASYPVDPQFILHHFHCALKHGI